MSGRASAVSGPAGGKAASQRIDRWLWCARFARTRTLAGKFAASGAIRLTRGAETTRVEKASAPVRAGDRLAFIFGGRLRVVEVADFGERRGPASEAMRLYTDHSPPHESDSAALAEREKGAGRPTKKDRRAIARLQQESGDFGRSR